MEMWRDLLLLECQDRLDQALVLFQKLETRWQIGRTLSELGELAIAQKDGTAARGYYTQALASFEEMKAVPDINRTLAALESLDE